MIPGWYWHRMNRRETTPLVIYVEPQLDKVGTSGEQTSQTLSPTEEELGRPLGDA